MWTAVELRELRIFLALAEELHFGRTGERLRISQPGVSEAVRSLEARIGTRLFERTSRRVSLTPAGEEFRRSLVPALAALDRALARASDRAASIAGPLRIGFTQTTDDLRARDRAAQPRPGRSPPSPAGQLAVSAARRPGRRTGCATAAVVSGSSFRRHPAAANPIRPPHRPHPARAQRKPDCRPRRSRQDCARHDDRHCRLRP